MTANEARIVESDLVGVEVRFPSKLDAVLPTYIVIFVSSHPMTFSLVIPILVRRSPSFISIHSIDFMFFDYFTRY